MGNGWWVTNYLNTPNGVVMLTAIVFWVIGSIVLHELAHGWAAIALGDNTPRELGHMTWNPFVHMGGMSLMMFALVGIAWGAMPVDPTRLRGRHADAKVSVAGPAMNLLLTMLSLLALVGWTLFVDSRNGTAGEIPDHIRENLNVFFYVGATWNFALMLFNLLPVPPLDGSRIVASFVPAYRDFAMMQSGQAISLTIFIVLFWFGGRFLFAFAHETVNSLLVAILAIVR